MWSRPLGGSMVFPHDLRSHCFSWSYVCLWFTRGVSRLSRCLSYQWNSSREGQSLQMLTLPKQNSVFTIKCMIPNLLCHPIFIYCMLSEECRSYVIHDRTFNVQCLVPLSAAFLALYNRLALSSDSVLSYLGACLLDLCVLGGSSPS